jgi:hypothetical protein
VALALSKEGNFPDRQWDVSQLGFIFCDKKTWRTKAEARETAQSYIETWNDYLSSNVYGYVIETKAGEEVESCWGFYGDYDAKDGVISEAKSVVDHLTQKGKCDHTGQMLLQLGV